MEKLHVVLLRKRLEQNENSIEWLTENYSQWVALGHFDDMFIYELNGDKNFLKQMRDDKTHIFKNSDDKSYYHPLYLIPHNASKNLNDDYRFIAIVRIHFPKSLNTELQFQKLVQFLPQYFGSRDLPYQVFYATEFSDMVLDVRSNNFSKLITSVLSFYGEEDNNKSTDHIEIGKRYTYFGMNASYLQYSKELMEETEDIIPMFSMRFSGYNMSIVKKQMNLIESCLESHSSNKNETIYSINGIDDVLLEYKNCRTCDLVELYRMWMFDDQYKCYRESESTTRVGVSIESEKINNW